MPRLTAEQLDYLRAQAVVQQAEDPDNFFAFACEELANDLRYWREVAEGRAR